MGDKSFSHRGYCGSIETSLDDECLYGKIQFIRDLVTYEAETVADLRAAFENAVDDYLTSCEHDGIDPDKPFSGVFQVRTSPEKHRAIAMCAAKNGLSINDHINHVFDESLSERKTVINLSVNAPAAASPTAFEYDESSIHVWPQILNNPAKKLQRTH